MRPSLRDRVTLIGTALGVLLCSLTISYAIGSTGLFFVIQTVFVFGGVLSYCGTAWPKWYRRRPLRTRMLLTYFGLLGVHLLVGTLLFRQLRFEWGGGVWSAISLAEVFAIVVVLTMVVTRPRESTDVYDRSTP